MTVEAVCNLPGLAAGTGTQNGRKLRRVFGLLRNSTIFRCAKNRDSNSPRRKPPKTRLRKQRGLIVLGTRARRQTC